MVIGNDTAIEYKLPSAVLVSWIHMLYIAGIDRVCTTTASGEVVMLQVNPVMSTIGTNLGDSIDGPAVSSTRKGILYL